MALDTSIFIYEFEANPRYLAAANVLFRWLESPAHRALSSTITLTEVLVGPYRAGDLVRAKAMRGLLLNYPRVEWVVPESNIADLAAQFRVRYGLRTVDALQVATAIRSNATCMVGNDTAFRRVEGIDILLLDDYL